MPRRYLIHDFKTVTTSKFVEVSSTSKKKALEEYELIKDSIEPKVTEFHEVSVEYEPW